MSPSKPPPNIDIAKISNSGADGKLLATHCVTEYIVSAAMAVNDTSIPPAAKITNTPSANSPITTLERAMSNKLDA